MATDRKAQRRNRVGFILVALVMLMMLVTIPLGLVDLIIDLGNPPTQRLYAITPQEEPDPATTTYDRVHVDIIQVDEIGETVTLRVSGTHFCQQDCTARDKITFYSVDPFGRDEEGLPANDSITLPAAPTQFGATLKLPIGTNIFRYPFDQSVLTLGFSLDRIGADNKSVAIPADEGRKQLFVTIRDRVNRLKMDTPEPVTPADIRPLKVNNFDYIAVSDLSFSRSVYLKCLVIAVMVLITVAVAYAVFLRTFDQVITNAGPIILGLYGVRVLILGGFPTDVTAIDLILTGIVVFFLLVTAARGLSFFWDRAGWKRVKPEPEAATEEKK